MKVEQIKFILIFQVKINNLKNLNSDKKKEAILITDKVNNRNSFALEDCVFFTHL